MDLRKEKQILGWCLYDWANSAFATVVLAAFFPIFFKQFVNQGLEPALSTARLGLANSLASLFIAFLAPFLGAIADQGGVRKKFLLFFAYLGVVMTFSLSLVSRGNWLFAIIIYLLALLGFSGGNIFYDALLPLIARKEKRDFVSALGYSFGYLGGGILFAFCVGLVFYFKAFALNGLERAIKLSFILVGIWWAVFSLPLLIFVKEPQKEKRKSFSQLVKLGFSQLEKTFREIRHLKTIFLFLLAYWFYIDGVHTVIRMAVDYGLSIGLKAKHLTYALLLTQFVGFPSAIGFGYFGTKIGPKRAIFIALSVYLLVTFWAALMKSHFEFYLLAVMVGLVQGGIQALSRSYYTRLIPREKAGEYFGFYNLIGKLGVILGPSLIGGVALLARSWGAESMLASRLSIVSASFLFIMGGVLFYFVDEKKGKEEVKHLEGL